MYICNNVYIKRLRFEGPLIYLPLVIDFQYVNYNIHITKYTTSIFKAESREFSEPVRVQFSTFSHFVRVGF